MAGAVGGQPAEGPTRASGEPDRRNVVLTTALETFARYGYRKTSMEDVATAARISRPGLYFLFKSKQELFAAAMTRGLENDLRAAAHALKDESRPLRERLLDAFDIWTGRYLGAAGGELASVAEAHRDVLGASVVDLPPRFHALVTDAVVRARASQQRETSEAIARTLISAAIGLKHQTASRDTFRDNLRTAIALLLR
jgi:AcrR family transcriptional regulator